jgi:transglutaminase-like putative cysteine protease
MESISRPYDITSFLCFSIDFVSDNEDVWATAKQTYNRGFGDCEDIAILYLNILYSELGIKGNLALLLVDTRSYILGGSINHAIVEVNCL